MQPPVNNGSVIVHPSDTGIVPSEFIINLAQTSDEFLPWGAPGRDRQLREFWPTEPVLAGALFTTIAKYVAFGYQFTGPESTIKRVQEVFASANNGAGFEDFETKLLLDAFTQDNAAWIELIRIDRNDPASPVISLNNLDSARCFRTGNPLAPARYIDLNGSIHELKWFQAMSYTEFPSPIEHMRGLQYCALTRLLRAAQIMRDITVYEQEKISGRFLRAIHIVGGILTRTIDSAIERHMASANSSVLTRYIQPAIVGAVDPNARVSHEVIELASLPDHFDKEQFMRWYINEFALAFGADYQDYAPLPGGNLGTASQSTVLHAKGRGKGPALFMSKMENLFNRHGIIPKNVKLEFLKQDVQQETEEAKLRLIRAQERKVRLDSLEITPDIARQLALDHGDIEEAYLKLIGESNATSDVTI